LIRTIDTSLTQALAATGTTPADQSGKAAAPADAFAEQLKKAAAKPADDAPATANRAQPAEGEKWRPVKGHDDYAEIIEGDRKGQFVNLNRGSRKGEAFTIEAKDGKSFHVYKRDGKDDLWVEVQETKEAKAAGTPRSEPAKGETWSPVNGTSSYADILTGKRNGYYVNISQGSSREGDAFHIVKRSGRDYHVYGSGNDRVWVEVGTNDKTGDASNGGSPASTTP
jgi:hypothetical protein